MLGMAIRMIQRLYIERSSQYCGHCAFKEQVNQTDGTPDGFYCHLFGTVLELELPVKTDYLAKPCKSCDWYYTHTYGD